MKKKFTFFFLALTFILGLTPIKFSQAITQNQINAEVQIVCPDKYGNWFSGSGTIIDPKGIILTNKHIVTDAYNGIIGTCFIGFVESASQEPNFGTKDNPNLAEVKYWTTSDDMDAAILYLDNLTNKIYPYVNIWDSNSDSLKFGDEIEVIGFPSIGGSTITYTSGDFSGFGSKWDGTQNYIKTSVSLNHGNSGGSAFDLDGNDFIGIPTFVISDLNSISYILSVNSIKDWLQNIFGIDYQNKIKIPSQDTDTTGKTITIQEDIYPPHVGLVSIYNNSKTEKTIKPYGNYFSGDFEAPFFSIAGAYDEENKIDGYFIYFGKNIGANPQTAGIYSHNSNFQAEKLISEGRYYFIYSVKDSLGNVSEPQIYIYHYSREKFFPSRLDIYGDSHKAAYLFTISQPSGFSTTRDKLFFDWSNNNLNGISGFYVCLTDKNVLADNDPCLSYQQEPFLYKDGLKKGNTYYLYIKTLYNDGYSSSVKYLLQLEIKNESPARDTSFIGKYRGYIVEDPQGNLQRDPATGLYTKTLIGYYFYISENGIRYDLGENKEDIIPSLKKYLAFKEYGSVINDHFGGRFYILQDNLYYIDPADFKIIPINKIDDLSKYIKKVGARDSNKFSGAEDVIFQNPMEKQTDKLLANRLKGKILLQTESKGEAYYVNPGDSKKYYLGRPADAFNVMRKLSLGVTHDFITSHTIFPASVSGKILLDVGDGGKAYYIYPKDKKAYYLGRPADAFNVIRDLGLGITNSDLGKIAEGSL